MIVKRNLSVRAVLRYTARPLAWATAWAVAAPLAYELSGEERLLLPFAPVAALAAALAIVIAFRNNAAFARWNEARAAWQAVLVAGRSLARQIITATADAAAAGTVTAAEADRTARELVLRLAAFPRLLAGGVRPPVDWARVEALVPPGEAAGLRAAAVPATLLLQRQSAGIREAIRAGALGPFDPISMEPPLAALATAQGTVERIARTPTPRQYAYFTRRFVQLLAAVTPFAVLPLVPDAVWWTIPLSLLVSGVFIVLDVTGSANDEPFAGAVTDVPIAALCAEAESDLREQLGEAALPPLPEPVAGYLW